MELIKDLNKEWQELLNIPLLDKIWQEIKSLDIVPAKEDIFNFCKFVFPKEIKIIIIGQDPYPNKKDACGIAFCAEGIPASLKNIFTAITNSDLMYVKPKNGDIRHWCRQGILLMNTALTTIKGESNVHAKLWQPYTRQIFQKLINIGSHKSVICWGNEAQNFIFGIDGNFDRLAWRHPSPMAQSKISEEQKFVNCDHFEILSQKYAIIWDKQLYNNQLTDELYLYTDGSCHPNNRSIESRGGYSIVVPKYDLVYFGSINVSEYCASNIRAEGIAIFKALKICQTYNSHPCILVTDSMFWVDMINCWMPSWDSKKIQEKENPDIVIAIKKIWEECSSYVKLQHIKSHTKDTDCHAECNDFADIVAKFARIYCKAGSKHQKTFSQINQIMKSKDSKN